VKINIGEYFENNTFKIKYFTSSSARYLCTFRNKGKDHKSNTTVFYEVLKIY